MTRLPLRSIECIIGMFHVDSVEMMESLKKIQTVVEIDEIDRFHSKMIEDDVQM